MLRRSGGIYTDGGGIYFTVKNRAEEFLSAFKYIILYKKNLEVEITPRDRGMNKS